MVKEHREPCGISKPLAPYPLPCLEREDTGTIMDIGPVHLPVHILTGISAKNPF
jgi:hypothetical protein